MRDPSPMRRLAAGVDIGGTFTDVVLIGDDGKVEIAKVLSTPSNYGDGIVGGLKIALSQTPDGPSAVTRVAHGTTVASNAILEKSSQSPALITTEGFRDVIEIGRLRLPRLYDVKWSKPPTLVPRELRFEVRERIGADGEIVVALDEKSIDTAIAAVRASGARSVAISFINAYANTAHEQMLRQGFAERAPEIDVSVASEISGQIREVERTSTAIVNAYLRPVLNTYLGTLREKLDDAGVGAPLFISQSTGGLTTAEDATRRPVTILESGPAAGVVAAAVMAQQLGIPNLISFDMGGTTAKAASIEGGTFVRSADFAVGGAILSGSRLLTGSGYPLQVSAIDLAEVGAGGGSIVAVDAGGGLSVGPESAGSAPGPACYGLGGERPTITDAAAILGFLNPAGIAGGTVRIDVERARAVFVRNVATPLGILVEDAAYAAIQIASATMLRALRAVSSERGRDPREYVLCAFGGNGPLLGPLLASQLGAGRVIVPLHPGLFSAVGLLLADVEREYAETMRGILPAIEPAKLAALVDRLTSKLDADLAAAGFGPAQRSIGVRLSLRYAGQTHALAVPIAKDPIDASTLTQAAEAFGAEHQQIHGHRAGENEPVELVTVHVVGRGSFERSRSALRSKLPSVAKGTRQAYFGPSAGWREVAVLGRKDLTAGTPGPCIIEEYDSTCLVPPGATASRDEFDNIDVRLG